MARHSLNDAEQGFLDALLDEAAVKVAVDLDPETAEVLGARAVSPRTLDQLEETAGQGAAAEEGPPPEPPPPPPLPPADQKAPPPVEVDAPPEPEEGLPPEEVAEPELGLPLRAVAGRAFSDKNAHPLALLDLLELAFDSEWSTWESETLYWGIRRNYGPIGELNRNKVMALRLASTTDVPWQDWDVFEDSGLAWNNIVPLMGAFQPLTPMQAAFTISCLREIRDEEALSHEVCAYVAAILNEHGWVYAPAEYFGNVHEVLEKAQSQVSFRSEVKAAWGKVHDVAPESISFDQDNPLDVHVLKLFVVQRYLQEREQERLSSAKPASAGSSVPPVPATS